MQHYQGCSKLNRNIRVLITLSYEFEDISAFAHALYTSMHVPESFSTFPFRHLEV